MAEQKQKPQQPPVATPCRVCQKRRTEECSHVDCAQRKHRTAGEGDSLVSVGAGCLRRTPTCRD